MTYAAATIFTWFSLLYSTIAPEPLLDLAVRYKLAAVGIVDQATTLAHARVAHAARERAVHAAYGTTLRMDDGFVLRALARTDDGYRNLCRLISAQGTGATVSYDLVRDHRAGLYLLCGGRQGHLWQLVRQGDGRALWALARLQALANRADHFLVECQQYRTDTSDDLGALEALLNLAEQGSVRAIATHDVRVLDGQAGRTLRLLGAIGGRTTFWANDPALPAWQKGHASPFTLPHPAD